MPQFAKVPKSIVEPEEPDVSKEQLELIRRLRRDIREAAVTLSPNEVRFVIGAYYDLQKYRIQSGNQIAAMRRAGVTQHQLLDWLTESEAILERDIRLFLQSYAEARKEGEWLLSIVGIGPILASGVLVHATVDKDTAPTVGHIWRFAGLDPSVKWLGTQQASTLVHKVVGKKKRPDDEDIAKIAREIGRRPENLRKLASRDGAAVTTASLAAAAARCPWSRLFKTTCFKISDSFVKSSTREKSFYGPLYQDRKAREQELNDKGAFATQAAEKLRQFRIGEDTEAYKAYSQGRLPPAHIDMRARRWVVKLFLSHYHLTTYYIKYGVLPPRPYVLEHVPGHQGRLLPPNCDLVPGLEEAVRKQDLAAATFANGGE